MTTIYRRESQDFGDVRFLNARLGHTTTNLKKIKEPPTQTTRERNKDACISGPPPTVHVLTEEAKAMGSAVLLIFLPSLVLTHLSSGIANSESPSCQSVLLQLSFWRPS